MLEQNENNNITLPISSENIPEKKTSDQIYKDVQESFINMANQDIEAEEISEDTQEETNKENNKQEQYSEIEKQAMDRGWIPKNKFVGEGKFRAAEEWMEIREFSDKYRMQSKELNNLRYTVEKLNEMILNQNLSSQKQKIQELEQKKLEAVQSGDVEVYKNIDDQIKEISQTYSQIKSPIEQPQSEDVKKQELLNNDIEVKNWYAKNMWADNADDEVIIFAKQKLAQYKQNNPQSKNIDVLRYVELETKSRYPEYFGIKTYKSNNVLPARNYTNQKSENKNQFTINDLPGKERAFIRRMAKASNMKEQDYINVLIKTGALKYER